MYFHPETSKDFPVADYDENNREVRLFCLLEHALRCEIKHRNWALSLDVYPKFSGATIIGNLGHHQKEIAFKRNTEDKHTLKALCMAFYEAVATSERSNHLNN